MFLWLDRCFFLRMLRTSIIVVLTTLAFTAHAERIVYEMSVLGYTFGEMVLTKTIPNDSVEVYTLHSKGETNFFWMNRKGESNMVVEYRNGQLHSSEYTYYNRGVLEKWSKTLFDGSKYIAETNEGTLEFSKPPVFSLIKLYFEPSWSGNRIFCEEDGSYASLQHDADKGIFDVRCQDGSRSTYHVKDGLVEMMEIHLGMANVKLKRVNR